MRRNPALLQTTATNRRIGSPLVRTFGLGILVGALAAIVTLAAIDGSTMPPQFALFAIGGLLSVLAWNRTITR